MIKYSLFKSNCILCESQISESVSICQACRNDLPIVEFACKKCALPIEASVDSAICGNCISQKTYVDYSENMFHFENPVDYLIRQMKFQHQLASAAVLADLFKVYIESRKLEYGLPDLLVAMPLHKKRLAQRGFNQSLEIVKPLAKALEIPIALDLVSRSKKTETQTHLNKQQRRKNVSGCFSMLNETSASHIVIVDDVVTTGATTNELAKLLKKSGVERVGVWSLARAELS